MENKEIISEREFLTDDKSNLSSISINAGIFHDSVEVEIYISDGSYSIGWYYDIHNVDELNKAIELLNRLESNIKNLKKTLLFNKDITEVLDK